MQFLGSCHALISFARLQPPGEVGLAHLMPQPIRWNLVIRRGSGAARKIRPPPLPLLMRLCGNRLLFCRVCKTATYSSFALVSPGNPPPYRCPMFLRRGQLTYGSYKMERTKKNLASKKKSTCSICPHVKRSMKSEMNQTWSKCWKGL